MASNYEGKYQNFMFMAGWRDMLEGMEQDFGIEYAKEALWNLMLVGTLEGQEPVTDKQSIIGFVKGCIQPVVKTSTANYNKNKENGIKGGRPKIEIDVAEAIRLHDEEKMSWDKVAKNMGVSTEKLRKARQEYGDTKKPKNPPVFLDGDKKVQETQKTQKGIEIAGFRF